MRLVIYVSRYCGSADHIEQALRDIQGVSKIRNPAQGITGVLFYQNRHFLQALEGEDEAVQALIAVLQDDPRHEDIQFLVDIPISERHFEQWNMDCLNLDNTELFTSETLFKLHDAYSRNVQISDAAFVDLLQEMLNTPGVEEILREQK